MYESVERIAGELRDAVASLQPSSLDGASAARLMELFTRAERLCAAARTLLAGRVEESKVWQREGHRTAADWVAAKTGVSSGQAIGVLETARNLESSPLTRQEFVSGGLSEAQAREISGASVANPRAERGLLERARTDGLKGLREECQRVRAAAVLDELVRYEQIRRKRFVRHWTDHDGAVRLEARLTPDAGAAVIAAMDAQRERIFREARRAGRREPGEAYAADALVELVTRPGDVGRSGPKAMVHVLVDHAALIRGHVKDGERCEIPGVGPIPVATARAFTNDAIIKALLVDGTDIKKVAHLKRSIPARLRTALEVRDPECVVPGCNVRHNLQIDHWVVDYADGGPASEANCARECSWHHYLRTHCGYRLSGGPGAWVWETPDDLDGTTTQARPPPAA
jgi:hypothetical protein